MTAPPTYAVLHEDATLLVVDKAAGVLSFPAPGSRERCLLDDLRRDGHKVAPVHRLDRDTSGCLLFCLDPARRTALEDAFRRHEVEKDYLALVHGVPARRRATIDVPILDSGATARIDRRGRRAVSHYVVEEAFPSKGPGQAAAALVRITLESGRHNQARVHMAHIGHPLVGDDKYGRRTRPGSGGRATAPLAARRCLLHAARLALAHPANGQRSEFRAPMPADFEDLLERLRAR